MKKIIAILLFIFVMFLVPCQETEERGSYLTMNEVLQIDGFLWMSWHPMQKMTYVSGIMTAHGAIMMAVEQSDILEDLSEYAKEFLLVWLYIHETLDLACQRIDAYYFDTGDLNTSIWAVIYYIYGMSWWDAISTKETPMKDLNIEDINKLIEIDSLLREKNLTENKKYAKL